MFRQPSPIVKQMTTMTCYAAALESFFAISTNPDKMTQSEIVAQWGEIGINGGVSEEKLLKILKQLDIEYVDSRNGRMLTEELVETQLKYAHVFLCHKSSRLNSHCLVIYGISHAYGLAQISYMDPYYGEYRWANLKDFNGKPWLLGWAHRYATGVLD